MSAKDWLKFTQEYAEKIEKAFNKINGTQKKEEQMEFRLKSKAKLREEYQEHSTELTNWWLKMLLRKIEAHANSLRNILEAQELPRENRTYEEIFDKEPMRFEIFETLSDVSDTLNQLHVAALNDLTKEEREKLFVWE